MNSRHMAISLALLITTPAFAQQMDHMMMNSGHLGAGMMPFDLARSKHVFTPSEEGGTQDVLSDDGDSHQIAMIRMHLMHEARAFADGDYSDPAAIHGASMPGLAELQAGAARMRVTFEALSQGGRIRFTSTDPDLVSALHKWFEAQARDHGPDAVLNGR